MGKGPRRFPVRAQDDEPSGHVPRFEGGVGRVLDGGGRQVRMTEGRLLDEPHTVKIITKPESHSLRKGPR